MPGLVDDAHAAARRVSPARHSRGSAAGPSVADGSLSASRPCPGVGNSASTSASTAHIRRQRRRTSGSSSGQADTPPPGCVRIPRSPRAVVGPAIRPASSGSPRAAAGWTATPREPLSCRHALSSTTVTRCSPAGRRSASCSARSQQAAVQPPLHRDCSRRRAPRRPRPASSPGCAPGRTLPARPPAVRRSRWSMRRPSGVSPDALLDGDGTSPSLSSTRGRLII